MKSIVRVAIVDPRDSSRAVLKNLLLGLESIWLEAECSRYDFFGDVIAQTQPDMALISLDADPPKGLALISKITQECPGCSVVVVSSSTEGNLILQAIRNGAKEFLSAPLKMDDFLDALDRIKSNTAGRTGESHVRASEVISVAGVSGGVGSTSLAINLACCLARNEKNSVVMLDLDFALGDADVWLDIIPDYTIADVADNITRLDYSLLKRSLTRHDSGAFLLPRPVQIDDETRITPDQIKRVIALLRATFTHVVIDVSKSFGALDMAALELSNHVLLVTQLDLPCLRNIVRLMQYFEHKEGLKDKVKVIVNRLGLEENQISLNKALETIGREIFWQIPNDYATMVEARNNGVPLILQAPRAKITKSIEQLAQVLGSPAASKPEPDKKEAARRGLFGFLASAK